MDEGFDGGCHNRPSLRLNPLTYAVSKPASGYAFAYMEIGSSNDPGWLSSGFYFYVNNEDYAEVILVGGN